MRGRVSLSLWERGRGEGSGPLGAETLIRPASPGGEKG